MGREQHEHEHRRPESLAGLKVNAFAPADAIGVGPIFEPEPVRKALADHQVGEEAGVQYRCGPRQRDAQVELVQQRGQLLPPAGAPRVAAAAAAAAVAEQVVAVAVVAAAAVVVVAVVVVVVMVVVVVVVTRRRASAGYVGWQVALQSRRAQARGRNRSILRVTGVGGRESRWRPRTSRRM